MSYFKILCSPRVPVRRRPVGGGAFSLLVTWLNVGPEYVSQVRYNFFIVLFMAVRCWMTNDNDFCEVGDDFGSVVHSATARYTGGPRDLEEGFCFVDGWKFTKNEQDSFYELKHIKNG